MAVEVIVCVLVALLVGMPLFTLLHELGHAVVAATLIGGPVTVLHGPPPRPHELRVGRIVLCLHGFVPPHKAWIGWARWRPESGRYRSAAALAGGPLTSAFLAAGCAVAAAETNGVARWVTAALAADAAAQMTSSGLPVHYPAFAGAYGRHASDGLVIRWLLTGGGPDPCPAQPEEIAPDFSAGAVAAARAAAQERAAARS